MQHKRFPVVVITMKLSEGAGDLKKGAKVSFVPAIMAPGGIIASDDERSKKNVSAWYSRRGDRVKVSLGAKKKKYYSATRFERLR